MRAGLQLVDYTWPGGPAALAGQLAEVARATEDAGLSSLSVMDHLWQMDRVGPPESPVLEAYTTLGYLAGLTSTITIHAMVTNVMFREPGLLAKAVSTLDVLSGGRTGLAIGAGWNTAESAGLGIPVPSLGERLDRLEEAVQICLQMWSSSEEPYTGRYYQLERTLNSPQPLSNPRPKLMIGGTGEKKTLRLVAQYADACNFFGGPDSPHKLEVLREHCDAIGRDYDSIQKTAGAIVALPIDPSALLDHMRGLHDMGFSYVYLMVPDLPLQAIEMIADWVIPEIERW